MKLTVPTSWNDHLIEEINTINNDPKTKLAVHEIYGTLQSTIVGGGRPSTIIPYVSLDKAENHINLAHKKGLEFNFLMNAICMGNREFIPEYHSRILSTLGWLNDIGVDTITVTIPYLMEIIKKQFPKIKICVSVTATAGTVQEASFFSDDLKVDRINIHFMANRDFTIIDALVKAVKCDLEVLANDPCLLGCPYREYHQTIFAHASQSSSADSPTTVIDYPGIKCATKRIQNRGEILKSPWIRPEDTVYWENAGIDFVKLAGREKPTEWITTCIRAYATRDFDGNIYDYVEKSGLRAPEYEAFLKEASNMEPLRFYIDNKSLDGFIEYFVKEKPRCDLGCNIIGCHHCYEWAKKTVRVNETLAKDHLDKLQFVLNRLIDSSAFFDNAVVETIKAKQNN
jgi:collagenase-like PrtC family protease